MKKTLTLAMAMAFAASVSLSAEEAAKPAEAAAPAAEATPVAKNDAPGSVAKGNQLNDEGKFAEAAAYLEGIGEQVAANGAKKREPWRQVGLANAYIGLAKFDEAAAAAQKALDLDGLNTAAWNNLGSAQAQSGKRAAAIETLNKGIEALKAAGKDASKLETNLATLKEAAEASKPKAVKTAEAKAAAAAAAAAPAAEKAAEAAPAEKK